MVSYRGAVSLLLPLLQGVNAGAAHQPMAKVTVLTTSITIPQGSAPVVDFTPFTSKHLKSTPSVTSASTFTQPTHKSNLTTTITIPAGSVPVVHFTPIATTGTTNNVPHPGGATDTGVPPAPGGPGTSTTHDPHVPLQPTSAQQPTTSRHQDLNPTDTAPPPGQKTTDKDPNATNVPPAGQRTTNKDPNATNIVPPGQTTANQPTNPTDIAPPPGQKTTKKDPNATNVPPAGQIKSTTTDQSRKSIPSQPVAASRTKIQDKHTTANQATNPTDIPPAGQTTTNQNPKATNVVPAGQMTTKQDPNATNVVSAGQPKSMTLGQSQKSIPSQPVAPSRTKTQPKPTTGNQATDPSDIAPAGQKTTNQATNVGPDSQTTTNQDPNATNVAPAGQTKSTAKSQSQKPISSQPIAASPTKIQSKPTTANQGTNVAPGSQKTANQATKPTGQTTANQDPNATDVESTGQNKSTTTSEAKNPASSQPIATSHRDAAQVSQNQWLRKSHSTG